MLTARPSRLGACALAALLLASASAVLAGAPAEAAAAPAQPITSRTSVAADASQVSGGASRAPDISSDGRWVVFESAASGLVPGFAPNHVNIYLADRVTGAVTLVTVPSSGTEANGNSERPKVSNNGRYVMFVSLASNLVGGDTNGTFDVYRRDVVGGTTQLISKAFGTVGNGYSARASMSGNGSHIVFESTATNLGSPDVLGHADVFLWSGANTLARMSETPAKGEANGSSFYPTISSDGSTVAFQSYATNLVAGGGNANPDVFVRPIGGAISRVSVPVIPPLANGGSFYPQLSDDGTVVAFDSVASNLVLSDTNAMSDAFARNLTTGTTTRVSVNAFGGQLKAGGVLESVSSTGARIAFASIDADVLFPPASNFFHLYLNDRSAGHVEAVDLRDDDGGLGNGDIGSATLTGDSRYVVFSSTANNLVRFDSNGLSDVFVRDRSLSISPFASWDALIKQQYLDFAGRAAKASEVTEWKAQLTNGEWTIGRFLEWMAHNQYWDAYRSPLLRLYWAFFLREPDAPGLAYWLGQYQGGKPFNEIAAFFTTSPEFTSTYGPLADSAFVQLVYGNVLQRKADAAGVAYWVDQLQHHGLKRGTMMGKFSESPEGQHVLAPEVDVLLVHLGMLRALPTKAQFATATQAVVNGSQPVPAYADGLRLSGPYAGRFP